MFLECIRLDRMSFACPDPDLTIREREHYVIVGGGDEGEWLKMNWRSDIPKSKQRNESLLVDVEQSR